MTKAVPKVIALLSESDAEVSIVGVLPGSSLSKTLPVITLKVRSPVLGSLSTIELESSTSALATGVRSAVELTTILACTAVLVSSSVSVAVINISRSVVLVLVVLNLTNSRALIKADAAKVSTGIRPPSRSCGVRVKVT